MATKVGFTAVALESVAVPPVGCDRMAQLYVSGSPSASLEPDPSNCTVAPASTVCGGPGFATGLEFSVEMVTVAG